MAELEEWTCEFGGLLMGAPDSAISLVGVDGLLSLADVRSSDLTLIQQHGLWPGDDYLNGREITLTLEVYGRTPDEFGKALNAVQAAFRAGQPERTFRFRFPGVAMGRTAFVNVRPRKRSGPLDLNFAYGVCNIVVELFSTGPLVYGDEMRDVRVSTDSADPVSAFTQWGSEPARPVVELKAVKNPVLTHLTSGQTFALSYTGDCVINAEAQTVRDGTGADIRGLIVPGSVWPEYPTGDHRIKLTSADASTDGTGHLRWREAWS